MDILSWATQMIQTALGVYGGLSVIVGTFLLGENVALAAFVLSAEGFINPIEAIVFVFIGSMMADIFWFFMTEFVFRKYYEKKFETVKKNDDQKFLMRIVDKHFFWILIFIKFLAGMRLFLTIYIVLKNRIPFHRKVFLDAIGTVLYLTILFPIGWFFGKGMSSLLSVQQSISNVISLLVFIPLVTILISRLVIFILKKNFQEKDTTEIA